ncbi:MAG: VTC domain-containing protein [Oligoflexales bacterium]
MLLNRLKKLLNSDLRSDSSASNYYEYKYLITHHLLAYIEDLLSEFIGHSDPYEMGLVNSVYYDTLNEDTLQQCLNGDANKVKFRIRAYDESTFVQVHQKFKTLSGVFKYKSKIVPIVMSGNKAPLWEELISKNNDDDFKQIKFNGQAFGPLFPSVRIQYQRHRYRKYDYRITLDKNIEAFSLSNGLPRAKTYAALPYHVLEIKTKDHRPTLPFNGLIPLKQVSFSKFMLGLDLLDNKMI